MQAYFFLACVRPMDTSRNKKAICGGLLPVLDLEACGGWLSCESSLSAASFGLEAA